jgi:hypothetical protein
MKRMLEYLIIVVSLLILVPSDLFAGNVAENIKISQYVSVYNSPGNNVTLTIAPIAGSSNKALIRITGTSSKLSGVVMLAEVQVNADNDDYGDTASTTTYALRWQGNLRTVVNVEGEFVKQAEVSLPDSQQKFILIYDKRKSQKFNQKDLLTIYQQQIAQGVQAGISNFNRQAAIDQVNLSIKKLEQNVKQSCKESVPMSIDWRTVSDNFLQKYSVTDYCAAPLVQVADVCDSADSDQNAAKMKKAIFMKIKKIICQQGKKSLNLSLKSDGSLQWSTVIDAANQDKFVQSSLKNILFKS